MSSSPDPRWLRSEVVLAIHNAQIAEHGGAAGVRDLGLLESALLRPQNLFTHEPARASIELLAATYGRAIASNHPFVDGNKRTAFVAMVTFLTLNGLVLTAPPEARYLTMLGVAEGSIDESQLAEWIAKHVVRDPAGDAA